MRQAKLKTSSLLKYSFNIIRCKPFRAAFTIILLAVCLLFINFGVMSYFDDPNAKMLSGYYKAGLGQIDFTHNPNYICEGYDEIEESWAKEPDYTFYKKIKTGYEIENLNCSTSRMQYYYKTLEGIVLDENIKNKIGYKLIKGREPLHGNEVVASEYFANVLIANNFILIGPSPDYKKTIVKINDFENVIGISLPINDTEIKIVGISSNNFNLDYLEPLSTASKDDYNYFSAAEYKKYFDNSVYSGLYFHKDFKRKVLDKQKNFTSYLKVEFGNPVPPKFIEPIYDGYSINDAKATDTKINFFDKSKTDLLDGEILVESDFYSSNGAVPSKNDYLSFFSEYYGSLDYKIVGVFEDEFKIPLPNTSKFIVNEEELNKLFLFYKKPVEENQFEFFTFLSQDMEKDLKMLKSMQVPFKSDPILLEGEENSHINYINDAFAEDFNLIFFPLLSFGSILIGVMIGVFATIMMFSLIYQSIIAKIKDIGLMRALGCSKKTVFNIFLMESIIIVIISFTISLICYFMGLEVYNETLNSNLYMTTYQFCFPKTYQSIITFAFGIIIAFCGSIIPIKKLMKKSPMEILRF